MSSAIVVATIALQGAAVGVSGELAVRSLFRKKDKAATVRVGKFFLGLFMAVKSIFFLSFHASIGETCLAFGRMADLFYHLAMTAGTHVLVTRVQSIVPIDWRRKALVFHSTLTILRLIIGMVDVGLIQISNYPDGTCEYTDQDYWGPVYTLFDTVLDLYVTFMISGILIHHIRSLVSDRMKVNQNLYTSVILHNVMRTVLLTIVNLISTIFIVMKHKTDVIMLLWPIINIAFVILVGYDSDVTKAIRKLRQRRWRSVSAMTSTIDLGTVPSTNQIPKRPTSLTPSDVEFQNPGHISVNNSNNNNANIDDDINDDLSLIHVERWKSELNLTEQQIQEQAGYKSREDNRASLPSFVKSTPSASYDTDNTLT
ncbi:unnamed protein product [Mucor hiemalis]